MTGYKREEINRIVQKIVENTNALKIILFGSYARGTVNKNSDLDLLVIEKQIESRRKEMVRLLRLVRGESLSMDIIPIENKEFTKWKNVKGNIYFNINKEGIVLYDKKQRTS